MAVPESNPPTVNPLPPTSTAAYETDFHRWTQEQAQFLQCRQWDKLDLPHLVEEIVALGKQQRQELRNRLAILIGHLLKWELQPQGRSRNWLATLRVQRRDIRQLLQDSPNLKPYLDEATSFAYKNARDLAMGETNLPAATFPTQCPYDLAAILNPDFYPGEPCEWVNE
jgi:hypothetical protein